MNYPLLISLMTTLSICLCLGCDSDSDASSESEESSIRVTAHYEPLQEKTDEPDRVLAVVNDRPIAEDEVERSLDRLAELYHHTRRPFDETVRDQKRREVLDRLIDRELLREHLANSDIDIPRDLVDQEMENRVTTRFGSTEAFQRFLTAQELSLQDFRGQLREELALRELILEEPEVEVVDDENLRAHYERIAKRRPAGERVHASTLSIRLPTGADQATRSRIRSSLEGSLQRLDDPAGFQALSDRIGQGPNSAKLEQLQWVERHQLHPGAAQILFGETTEEGLTPIVETPLGFEVFWIHGRRQPGIRGFDEVEDLLQHRARQSRIEERRRRLLDQLRDTATITIELEDTEDAEEPR